MEGSNDGAIVEASLVGARSNVGSNEGPLSVFTTDPIFSKNIIDMMKTVDLIVRIIKRSVKCNTPAF